MFKNVASQKLIVYAFDATTNLPKTGDAANLTAYVSKDYGAVTVLGDTSATEMDATNAKGYYLFDLTQGETNADTLLFSAKSSTANVVVIGSPAAVFTSPPNFTTLSINGSGLAKADVDTIKTQAVTAASGITFLASVGTAATSTAQTGDNFARLGAPAGASVSADVAAVKSDSAAIKTKTDSLTFTVANQVDANVLTFPTTFRSGIRKNVALAKFEFLMTDSTNHNPVTGLTVTATRSIDGAAFGAGTLSAVTELSNGIYFLDFAAGDLNGRVVTLRLAATGADDLFVTLVTDP